MDYGMLFLLAATTCYWFYRVHCRLNKIWDELDKIHARINLPTRREADKGE